jgi:hypothetical protein
VKWVNLGEGWIESSGAKGRAVRISMDLETISERMSKHTNPFVLSIEACPEVSKGTNGGNSEIVS